MHNTKHKIAAGIATAAIAIASFAIPALAANNGTDQFGPFHSTSPDNGCAGVWANDTFDRFFKVHENGDGTFRVTEDFKNGSFVTTGPASPGSTCPNDPHHGTVVTAGINGNMGGTEGGTVTGGTYNPTGCSAPLADCTTTAGFVSAVFGPAASFNVTSWNFEYNSSDKSLAYHHWQDKSSDGGNGEQFIGDIATQ